MLRNLLNRVFALGLALQLAACSGPVQESFQGSLRIGVLPDESESVLRERLTPLFEFIHQETGLAYELVVPANYGELVQLFGNGQIDLAYFGGVTFMQAHTEHGAVPLVMRDVDSRFTSVLVAADDSILTLKDLRGKNFGFGSRLSTSGHLMPRHFLREEHDLTPEEYFHSIQYTGRHDRTAYLVRDGVIDAGAMNAEILNKMFADGRLHQDELRIILITPPYPDYVWAMHPRIQPVYRERIRRAFLQLSRDDPEHAAILSGVGASSFYPAVMDDYALLRKIMAKQGML